MNKDWKLTKKGDPLFLDIEGNTLPYLGQDIIWPVFISEVAYKEKKIAMSFTKKEVICSSTDWVDQFLKS